LSGLLGGVQSENVGEVASEFDAVHNIHRARLVGSIDDVVPAAALRPRLIEAIESGMQRGCERVASSC
jgi:hypothetical protein